VDGKEREEWGGGKSRGYKYRKYKTRSSNNFSDTHNLFTVSFVNNPHHKNLVQPFQHQAGSFNDNSDLAKSLRELIVFSHIASIVINVVKYERFGDAH
jgi:hypothetical protein